MYIVRKRVKNHWYLYEQETYRVGKKVKTRNRYIGPAGTSGGVLGGAPIEPRSGGAIQRDLEEAMTLRDILKDTLLNHRCKPFLKYRGRGDNSFAEINATALDTGSKAKHLDTLLSESGYADFDELDLSVDEYFAMKGQLRAAQDRLNTLRKERTEAGAYHRALGWGGTRESLIRPLSERISKPSRKKSYRGYGILKALADKARVNTPKRRTYSNAPSKRPHLRRVGTRLVYVSDLGAIKRAKQKDPYADKRRRWRKVLARAQRNLGPQLSRENRAYKNRFRETRYINFSLKVRKAIKKPGKFFNELVPNVGQAKTADRYIEAHTAEAPAAPGGKGGKAE